MSFLSAIPMKLKAVVVGLAALLLSIWWTIRKERSRADKAEAARDAAKRDMEAAKVKVEAAQGEAAVAKAERTVIVEALDDQAAGAAAAREVTRAAAEVVDHPDRAAARARVGLPAHPTAADDHQGPGGGEAADVHPARR